MKQSKLIVIYPVPSNLEDFERRYAEEHIPMAIEKLVGKTKVVTSLITSNVNNAPARYHRVAEIYFNSTADLIVCLGSPGGQETAAHAIEISSGGAPLFLMAEVEVIDF
ncbi:MULTISPECIES: EthD family reductase [Methylomonas]|jgi:uncharacterized protein (TIGR02118 family)|uniref:Ethyl tert-butyl ether degradation protein EthD n=1 Tax=Methylomonas methanica TaxID=421 RepID=A0A177MSH7_METMH|nr:MULTISPECIES: EthD family reductase [Methylomonas]NBS16631.1 EthD family reductase [Gammaproteobacteria bacterium]NBT45177.1 EthD family reductase [Gammaproteobacteria bacterium]NBY21943.1 EthD family reductase [Gammaproteobacteria bacterium]NOV30684.1 EthD family reductase [Methylomonas sp. ZR1]OAI07219.1 ethyl tert-butyl ether degradation protein EthD [Methylomonas methanica]